MNEAVSFKRSAFRNGWTTFNIRNEDADEAERRLAVTHAGAAAEPSDAQIMALWRECSIPTDENDHTTGPLPFARAVLALTSAPAEPLPAGHIWVECPNGHGTTHQHFDYCGCCATCGAVLRQCTQAAGAITPREQSLIARIRAECDHAGINNMRLTARFGQTEGPIAVRESSLLATIEGWQREHGLLADPSNWDARGWCELCDTTEHDESDCEIAKNIKRGGVCSVIYGVIQAGARDPDPLLMDYEGYKARAFVKEYGGHIVEYRAALASREEAPPAADKHGLTDEQSIRTVRELTGEASCKDVVTELRREVAMWKQAFEQEREKFAAETLRASNLALPTAGRASLEAAYEQKEGK